MARRGFFPRKRFGMGNNPRWIQITFMDALNIEKAVVAGFDWGARTANIVAALWPEGCKAMVSLSGYLIGTREANQNPLPQAELAWWDQFYFATERGKLGYAKYMNEFAMLIWQIASPKWETVIDCRTKKESNPWST